MDEDPDEWSARTLPARVPTSPRQPATGGQERDGGAVEHERRGGDGSDDVTGSGELRVGDGPGRCRRSDGPALPAEGDEQEEQRHHEPAGGGREDDRQGSALPSRAARQREADEDAPRTAGDDRREADPRDASPEQDSPVGGRRHEPRHLAPIGRGGPDGAQPGDHREATEQRQSRREDPVPAGVEAEG